MHCISNPDEVLGKAVLKADHIIGLTQTRIRNINVALFTPEPFITDTPQFMEQWLCQTSTDGVTFSPTNTNATLHFEPEQFLVDQQHPNPTY